MNRKDLLREVARLHAEHGKKYADKVPYNPAHEHPHDGKTTDLSLWNVDRSAPPSIDDELNRKIMALIGQLDDTPATRSTVDDPDEWTRLQQHAAQYLTLPEVRRGYKRDDKGRFSSTGRTGGAGVRKALSGHETAEAVGAAATVEARRITGQHISFQMKGDPQLAAEHCEGVLRGLQKYPDTPLERVQQGGDSLEERTGAFAVTEGRTIVFTDAAQAAGPDAYRQALKQNHDEGEYGGVTEDPMGVALHEFGHVRYDRGAGGFAGQITAERMAAKAGESVDEYVRRNISGYATTSGYELGAEAFADVMLNGGGASRLSKEVVKIEEIAQRQ